MKDTTFAGACLHEGFVGLDYPSYGTDLPMENLLFEAPVPADPRARTHVSASIPEAKPEINVTILALDLGTKCGYAIRNRDGKIVHGTEAFTPRKSWTPGQRWQRFRGWLSETIVKNQVNAIVYEDVRRHIGTDAAHAYGAFLALMELAADSHRLTLAPVGVGVIKKHWTGRGNAKKDEMLAEAKRRGFRPETDNDADALAILDWAIKQEASRA